MNTPIVLATILIVTAQNGAKLERTYATSEICVAMMHYVMMVEDMIQTPFAMIQCIPTDQITISPRPPKKPEDLK
jgi:hypothetical protein